MPTHRISLRRMAAGVIAAGTLMALPAAAGASSSTTIIGTHSSKLGTVISNSRGYSLYLFQGRSCTGACARTWVPLMAVGKLEVASHSGLSAKLLGRVRRGKGYQLTYRHHALYQFAGDHKAGQIRGEGVYQYGGYWYLLNKRGNELFSPQVY